MHSVNEAEAKHTEEMNGEYSYLTKTLTDLQRENDNLQKNASWL
jgi:hypothetical protein